MRTSESLLGMPLPKLDSEPDDQRRRVMRAVKATNTGPELCVRRIAHRLGRRYRLHRKDLPGAPDLVFARDRRVIFVHGCFWHGHDCKRGARTPKTNRAYWEAKIARNVARDRASLAALADSGWRTLVIWECETKNIPFLERCIACFLNIPGNWDDTHGTPLRE